MKPVFRKQKYINAEKNEAQYLKKLLIEKYELFKKKAYFHHLESLDQWKISDPELNAFKAQLTDRFETIICPATATAYAVTSHPQDNETDVALMYYNLNKHF